MRSRAVFALLGCVSVLGCTTHLPSVTPNQRPTGKEAFVYGRFHVTSPLSSDAGQPHESIAIVMRCDDGREYRIRFDDDEPIVVLAAAPSHCQLEQFLYLDAGNAILGETPFPEGVVDRMRLDAGRAYYLGDFRGSVAYEIDGTFRINFLVRDWRNEFATTTREFRAQFPKLRDVVTINQLAASKHE